MMNIETTDTAIPAADGPVTRDHNLPPIETPDQVIARLKETYQALEDEAAAMLADANARVPARIETKADNAIVAEFVPDMRDLIGKVNATHTVEKNPFLRGGQAVDQYFFSIRDRLAKGRDITQARGNDYTARLAAAERAERERVAREQAAEAARLAQEEAKRRQAAADALAAAERARKQENIDKHQDAAATAAVEAETLAVDGMIARDKAEAAQIATLAPAADLVRTRLESGRLATGKEVGYAEIKDRTKLDFAKLAPHFKLADIEKALNAYAKANDYAVQMDGASIGKRVAGDYR